MATGIKDLAIHLGSDLYVYLAAPLTDSISGSPVNGATATLTFTQGAATASQVLSGGGGGNYSGTYASAAFTAFVVGTATATIVFLSAGVQLTYTATIPVIVAD